MKTVDANSRWAALIIIASALVWPVSELQANERHDPGSLTFPRLALPGISRGEAAIRNLGQHLPAVAQSYGQAPDELRGRLLADRTLHVDETGRLLYLEPAFGEDGMEATEAETAGALAATEPLANTFLLHSRPGAKRVIYLDFDGHVLTGTAWNSGVSTINCPAWNIDGDPSSFGDNERTVIQGIWRRVAEDYLPFDVDVTTEYPGEAAITRSASNDELFGMRVLISPISGYFGNYGGIAYVGAFDYIGDYYKPALVFPRNLPTTKSTSGKPRRTRPVIRWV